jgi:hypothetical protein
MQALLRTLQQETPLQMQAHPQGTAEWRTKVPMSNDELFAKGAWEASQIEARIGRKLTSEEFSDVVWWYMNTLRFPLSLSPPNPVESRTIEEHT